MLFYLSSAVLTAALVAGGGTHVGFFGDAVLQLLAIPLLCGALWPAFSRESPHRKSARLALWVCVIAASVSAIQLFPLYFDYWFSGSGFLPKSTGALPAAPRTHTLSLTPEASWAAALSLIVPLSVFAAAVQLGLSERIRLCFLLAGLGAVSLGLGFLQMAQGPASGLRFYEFTNPSEAVGFFANRNHFAALLNVTLVLAALWLWMTADAALRQSTFGNRSILWLAAAAAFLVADAAGLAMARSRAGIFLAIIALLGIVATAYKQTRRTGSGRRQRRGGDARKPRRHPEKYPRLAPQPIRDDALLTGPLEPTNEWYAIAKIACLKLCEATIGFHQLRGRRPEWLLEANAAAPGAGPYGMMPKLGHRREYKTGWRTQLI